MIFSQLQWAKTIYSWIFGPILGKHNGENKVTNLKQFDETAEKLPP